MIEITPKELYEKLKNKDFILVDIRTKQEFDNWHIVWTDYNIDFYQPDFLYLITNFPSDKQIIIYCHAAHRTMYALNYLVYNWYENFTHLFWWIELRLEHWFPLSE